MKIYAIFRIMLIVSIFNCCTQWALAQENLPLRGLDKSENSDNREIFQEDATNPEQVNISKPKLEALVSISKSIDPLLLDATTSTPMSLTDVLKSTLINNLDISISGYNEKMSRARLFSSMGKFLPDIALSYRYTYLNGVANIPFGQTAEPLRFDNPFILTSAGFKYFGYRGGKTVFTALQNRNNLRAARHQNKATINDTIKESARLYYDLLLQEAILQIRIKAVETSIEQLNLSKDLKTGRLATNLDVLQAETQLSQDRQNLIDQQIQRREASIKLAQFLNLNQEVDIVPSNLQINKTRIISDETNIARLLHLAIDNRSELKQFEEMRLAAKKQIIINQAKLHPSFEFSGNVFGIGETLSKTYELAPITLAGAITSAPAGTRAIRSRQITSLYTIGFNFNWNFEGLGSVAVADTYEAKLKARQAVLQQKQELNKVLMEVRSAYLHTLQTDKKIEEAIAQVRSASEELRLSQLRYQNGIGKNIDVLRAQQDYTNSLIEKVKALVNFNVAQINLLRDTGLISLNTAGANHVVVK